jgi:hypothetical protein
VAAKKETDADNIQTVRVIWGRERWLYLFIMFPVIALLAFAPTFFAKSRESAKPYFIDVKVPAGSQVKLNGNGRTISAVVQGQQDSELRVYDANNGRLVGTFKYPSPPVSASPIFAEQAAAVAPH